MISSPFCLIALLFLNTLSTQVLNPNSNIYFENVRTGTVILVSIQSQHQQPKVISTSYTIPFHKTAQPTCHVALHSLSIEFDNFIKNKIKVSSGQGCSYSYINLTIISSIFNSNVVNYMVFNQKVYKIPNFVVFSAQTFKDEFRINAPIKKQYKLDNFNTSNSIKTHSFFSGFQLFSLNDTQVEQNFKKGFSIQILQVNKSSLTYAIHLYGNQKYRGQIAFVIMLYNQHFLNTLSNTHLITKSLKLSNFRNIILIDPQLENQQDIAFFMGFNKIYAENHIIFQFEITNHGQLRITSSNNQNEFEFTFLIFTKQTIVTQKQSLIDHRLQVSVAEPNLSLTTLILIVVGSVSAVIVLVIVICFCRSKKIQQSQDLNQPDSQQRNKKQSCQSSKKLKQSQLSIDDLKEEICNICFLKKIHLMTHCLHFYHLQCIKTWLSQAENCPECNKQLMGRKITVFCRECSAGYVLGFDQLMLLDNNLGLDQFCGRCKNRDLKQNQKENRSEKSEQVWLQYAIQSNQNLFMS